MVRKFATLLSLFVICFNGISQDYELKGSTGVYKDLLKMHRGLRVLYLAAHPDDENTRLIAYFENEKNIENNGRIPGGKVDKILLEMKRGML